LLEAADNGNSGRYLRGKLREDHNVQAVPDRFALGTGEVR